MGGLLHEGCIRHILTAETIFDMCVQEGRRMLDCLAIVTVRPQWNCYVPNKRLQSIRHHTLGAELPSRVFVSSSVARIPSADFTFSMPGSGGAVIDNS